MIEIKRNGNVFYTLEDIGEGSVLSRQLMSDDYITLKFSLLRPEKFELGDYCDCDFGRFELVSPYNPTYNKSTGGYDYELRMDAEYRKWKNKIFQYRPQYGGLEATWALTSTIGVMMEVFLYNLKSLGYKYRRETDYVVEYGADVDLSKSYPLSFSNTNLLDALTQIAEQWETEWWITDNIIHIGKCELGAEADAIDFETGVNVGEMSSSSSRTDYITRLYVFGSTKNIPARYRKKLEFDIKKASSVEIYDTARPLSIDFFRNVEEGQFGTWATPAGKATTNSGLSADLCKSERQSMARRGNLNLALSGTKVKVAVIDNTGAASQMWQGIFADKGAIFGYYFNCHIDLKVTIMQESETAGEYVAIASETSRYTEKAFVRHNSGDVGSFALPDISFSYKTSTKQIYIAVSATVTLEGSALLEFDHGIEYTDDTGKPITQFDAGAALSDFKICLDVPSGTHTFSQKYVEFPIEYLSGDLKGEDDYCTYHDGEDAMYCRHHQPSIGDRFKITDNIISAKVPTWYYTDDYESEIVKTGVVERHLMLPHSWNNGHNWIDAKENMSTEEIVEGVVVLEDIFPKSKCTISDVLSYKIEQIDEETNKHTGIYDTYYLVATDDIELKQEYLLSGESNFKINFNSGSLNGMTFEFDLKNKGAIIDNFVAEDGSLVTKKLDRQYFHIYANEDYGRLLPDAIIAPKKGDEFYVLNYDVSYLDDIGIVDNAEEELLKKGKEYMEKVQIDPNTYTCPMYWQDAQKHGILPLGQRINLNNSAYFADGKRLSRVIGVECCLDIPYDNPTYTVGESLQYSRLGEIDTKIDELTMNGRTYIQSSSSSGASVYLIKENDNTPASDANAYSAKRSDANYVSLTTDGQTIDGKKTFLSLVSFLKGIALNAGYSISEIGDAILRSLRLGDYSIDADGNATLGSVTAGDVSSPDYSETAESGYAIARRNDGKYKMTLTDLEVWGKAIFHELEIRKLSYVGGNYIFSPAGCTIDVVNTQFTGFTRCFFMAEDSDKSGGNMWRKGDLALCEEFDTDKRTKGNRRYWRKVVGISTEADCILADDGTALYDGRKFHFIDLSTTDCEEGSDTPQAGDAICCLGNQTDTERQNAITIETVGDMAPAIIQYEGIKTYTLTGKDKTVISPKGNRFIGEFYAKAGGQELSVEMDRISLKADAQAREYRNIVPDSRLRLRSGGYGVGMRDVLLEQGKTYTMSAKGTADKALTDGGGELAVIAYNDAWTWQKKIAIKSTAEDTASVVFSDVPENGVYHVAAYAFHETETSGYGNMRPQEKGTFTLDYVQIEEGSEMTAWTPSEEDAAVSGNLLRRIDEAGWTLADGTTVQKDAFIADGRHTAVAHLKNDTDNVSFMLSVPTDVEGESVYTLSLWARGTGTFTTHLYPDSVTYTEDNQGHASAIADGTIENTLTTDWRKYAIRMSTKRKAENLLQNAAFIGFDGWTAVETWTIDGNSLDNTAAARLTALQGDYGELVQTVKGMTKGAAYTLQMTVIGSVNVFLMGVNPEDVYVDGVKTTPTSGYLVALPTASNWTEHIITFKTGAAADMTLRLRSFAIGARIGKPMLSAGHMRSAWRSREDRGETLIPVRLAARSEIWVSAVKLEKSWRATEYTERTLTAADLLPSGIDIYNNKIIATSDTFEVRNQQGDVTTTVTADGQLTAGILATQNRGEGYLRAEDGMMEVYNPDGQKNIRFGLDKNSGMMVLEYYNNQGTLLYNLGPGGLTNRGLQTASLEAYTAEHAGTFFNNRQSVGSMTVYSDDVYHTADDGCYVINSEFRSRLMPTSVTTAGYQPLSALKQRKDVYYYQAARVQTAYAVDEENGITTEALAKEADQRWFSEKPICEDGALNLLTSDAQIMEGERLHWGTRKSGLQQLAIYVYEWYEGERERKEIFVGD